MNKFFAIALLAFVAIARAEVDLKSQDAKITNQETLPKNQEIYRKYCSDTREHMLKSIKETSNEAISQAFNKFFSSIENVGQDVLSTVRETNNRINESIMGGKGGEVARQVDDVQLAQKESTKILDLHQKKLNENEMSTVKTVVTSFQASLKAIAAEAFRAVTERANELLISFKEYWGGQTAIEFCKKIEGLNEHYKTKFFEFNAQLEQPSVSAYENVACHTTHSVLTAHNLCQFAIAAQPHMTRLTQAWTLPSFRKEQPTEEQTSFSDQKLIEKA